MLLIGPRLPDAVNIETNALNFWTGFEFYFGDFAVC
jgi:hypothetical protein